MKTILLSSLLFLTITILNAQPEHVTVLDTPTVNLLNFSAKKEASGIQLNWSSENESKLSHFTLEKSLDGKSYDDCAVIFGAEMPENTGHFSFKDKRVNTKSVYYRLKIVETSGAISYSQVYKVH